MPFSATNMQDKKQLRKYFSELRKSAKTTDRDQRIAERVIENDLVKRADTVLLFASFGSEPDTWALAQHLLEAGKQLSYPRCGANGIMTFHTVDALSQLVENPNSYGIREPDEKLPCPVISSDTVCIVPGLSFTENGGRLGYGGGFYDRFLAQNIVHTIALAYEECISDKLPEEQHDLRVDIIVTEERTVLCSE
ncbi:MAG: 5-formyltetrahydrofolate cyclo-ligase [Ruminococcus sp.]|nr:5-formyltetrahydrofolate cyclo-ligase [Ruminococcus sp.]